MSGIRDDLVDLFDHAEARLRERMRSTGDHEWRWSPTPDDRLSLRWRLAHLAHVLGQPRNRLWLGLTPVPVAPADDPDRARNAADAVHRIGVAHADLRSALLELDDAALAEPVGAIAGPYGEATRRAFVLHVVDEFVHHVAEACLLRDVYAHRPR